MKIPLASVLFCFGLASAQSVPDLRLIGEFTLPTGTMFERTEVGGLSGIDFDPETGRYYLLSDDRSSNAPARFYTADIAFSKSNVEGVSITSKVTLQNESGAPFPEGAVDPEGIRLLGDRLYWTSEGQNDEDGTIDPGIFEMTLKGDVVRALRVPERFLPSRDRGVRSNLAFESLAITPDGGTLYTATENALLQDGPAASLASTSVARVTSYDVRSGDVTREFVYVVDPIPAAPQPLEEGADNGLTELLALGEDTFIALERSYASGAGNANRLYYVDASNATDVSDLASLRGATFAPARKTLIVDLTRLGVQLDNHEGLSFGPNFDNGNRSLVVMSDNNFSDSQVSQFLVFEMHGSGATQGENEQP